MPTHPQSRHENTKQTPRWIAPAGTSFHVRLHGVMYTGEPSGAFVAQTGRHVSAEGRDRVLGDPATLRLSWEDAGVADNLDMAPEALHFADVPSGDVTELWNDQATHHWDDADTGRVFGVSPDGTVQELERCHWVPAPDLTEADLTRFAIVDDVETFVAIAEESASSADL